MSLQKNIKHYLFCPAGTVTGGAELIHQLVNFLNQNERTCYLAYYNPAEDDAICKSTVPVAYQKYNILTADSVEDKEGNIIILHESVFNKYKLYKNTRVIFWWLSVNNFYECSQKFLSLKDYFKWNKKLFAATVLYRMNALIKYKRNYFKNNITVKELSKADILNCYQSEYAQFYLNSNGFKQTFPLKDYINDDFFENITFPQKENIVLYNPKKGIKFTKRLIELSKGNFKWVPLENFTRSEMIEMLKISKLYIDFGTHPGKDRIPREAAMSNCCVITGMKGSAKFFEDVSIDNYYKIDEKNVTFEEVVERIKDIVGNYESHIENFAFYRNQIKNEKKEFFNQIKYVFKIQ